MKEVFQDEGIVLHTGTRLQSIEKTDQGFTVHFDNSEGRCSESGGLVRACRGVEL